MTTEPIARLDEWIRGEFAEINTELEDAYFVNRVIITKGAPRIEELKQRLLEGGRERVAAILADGRIPDGLEAYALLGAVGYYMGACHRHEIDQHGPREPSRRTEASVLSNHLGFKLRVSPRFVSGHQSVYNRAHDGRYRVFTFLPDEEIFLTNNGVGTLAYIQAADALRPVPGLGPSSPLATYCLERALTAMEDVYRFNIKLDAELDIERFYFSIRPYYKTYRVGRKDYRGANAGDFAAINEIDLILGLCRATDPFYQELLAGKNHHMAPKDQQQLAEVMDTPALVDLFVEELSVPDPSPTLVRNAELFLEVCRVHGEGYAFHHDTLVEKFLVEPSKTLPQEHLAEVTASGPPLDVVVAELKRLRDLREAALDVPGLPTAGPQLARIRELIAASR